MRPSSKIQQSYVRGMIEGVSQHLMGEALPSVLYLENYNPNIEIHSLVKRKHIATHDHDLSRSVVSPRYFPVSKFIANSLGALGSLTDDERDYPVYAFDILPISNPKSKDAFVVFGRRRSDSAVPFPYTLLNEYPATYVASTAWEYLAGGGGDLDLGTINQYQEAIASNIDLHANSPYAGWFVLGRYSAHWKYGESILFVTIPIAEGGANSGQLMPVPDDDRRYFAPVYKWYRWDITKKRENDQKWWHGLNSLATLTNKNLYTRWKVKTPTKVAFGDSVQMTQWKAEAAVDALTKPIQILIAENDFAYDIESGLYAAGYEYYYTEPKDRAIKKGAEFDYTYADLNDVGAIEYFSANWINSLHIPDINSYKAAIAARLQFGTADLLYDIGNMPIYLSADTYGTVLGRKAVSGQSAIVRHKDHTPATGSIDKSTDPKDLYHLKVQGISMKTVDFNIGFLVTWLPNYNEIGLPRLWCEGEKIPIVLTATVDGNEVPIFKGSYAIKGERPSGFDYAIGNAGHENKEILLSDGRRLLPAESLSPELTYGDSVSFVTDLYSNAHRVYGKIVGLNGASPVLYHNPTTEEYLFGKTISFTIRIEKDFLTTLLDQDVTSLNLYASRPSENNSLLDSVGVLSPQEPPIGLYSTPMVDDIIDSDNADSYEGYGLVKRFLISGANTKPDYDLYRGEPFNTNAWLETTTDDYIWAVPLDDLGDPVTTDPPLLNEDLLVPTKPTFRPDFILWDYPLNSPPLNLQYSGKEWKGVGAKFVVNIKSLVFIGGCVNQSGEEEQALIRYCGWQNGVPLYDLFPLENYIKIGSLPHTAVVEFREQLVWFNRQAHYRMVMPELFNISTWEFLEAVDGGGTFCQKTVVNTPYGLVYANEMGIWLTEGTFPVCLTQNSEMGNNITSLYQALSTRTHYAYSYLHDVGIPIIGDMGYNEYMELSFDDKNNELVFTTPVGRRTSPLLNLLPSTSNPTKWEDFNYELRLIFSFANKNWRAESYVLKTWVSSLGVYKTIKTSDIYGRYKAMAGRLISMYTHFNPEGQSYTEAVVSHYSQTDGIDTLKDRIEIHRGLNSNQTWIAESPVVAYFITHVLGDNINDSMLRKVFAGAIPRAPILSSIYRQVDTFIWGTGQDNTVPALSNMDPELSYWRRSPNWANQVGTLGGVQEDSWRDLVRLNFATRGGSGGLNIFQTNAETPAGINAQNNPQSSNYEPHLIRDNTVGRESLALSVPLNTPFRRLIVRFASEIVVKVHDFLIEFSTFKRRTM